MPQTATAAQTPDDQVTRVRLKDGTTLRLKGANLSPDEVSKRVAAYRATQISAPDTKPPLGVEPADDSSFIGGAGRRAYDLVAGGLKTIGTPPATTAEKMAGPALVPYRIAKGEVSSATEAGRQSYQQVKQGLKSFSTDPVGGGLEMARGAVTGASIADPFATSSVTNVNKLEDAGKNHEAIGQGAFDILNLIAGGTGGKGASTASRINKLTAAAGETGETVKNLTSVLPDLDQTVRAAGSRPKTPTDFFNTIKSTSDRIDQTFNQALFPIRNQRVVPMNIADAIRNEITPDMRMTAEGRAEAAELKAAAVEYEKPWTYNQLNAKRMTNNSRLSSFYKRETQGQSAALSAVQVKIMKAVRDGAAEVVYDAVDKANPGLGARQLKLKQGALWDLSDQLDTRVGNLADAQAAYKGTPLIRKLNPSTYASSGGVHTYVRGAGKLIPGGGPLDIASQQVTKAFKSPTASLVRRRAALGLPITALQQEGPDE